MARKAQVAVEPRPSGRWAVQTDGTSRADSLHDRQSDAIKRGRELAKKELGPKEAKEVEGSQQQIGSSICFESFESSSDTGVGGAGR